MQHHAHNALILSVLLMAACGPTMPVKPATGQAVVLEEPPVERPVIQVDRTDDAIALAIGLIKENNYRQAEANFEEIVKVRPDIGEAYFNLGLVKFKLKKYVDAINQLTLGLKIKPQDTGAINLLALCQRSLGKFVDAEASYKRALALDPINETAHFNIGVLYELYLFKPELALEHYREYQKLQKTADAKVAGWVAALERKAAK